MSRHFNRSKYLVVHEGIFSDDASSQCSLHRGGPPSANGNSQSPLFKFGRMFDERQEMMACLTELGLKMGGGAVQDSNNPSGYTYLGQFIAHEITFDKTKGLPATAAQPDNFRSPQLDLDSLYGNDDDRGRLVQAGNPALLKIGKTSPDAMLLALDNDLFRNPDTGVAEIADERNDENLVVAQVHVALISFHNKIVKCLIKANTPESELFESARAEVVKHFQWIVLHDYLATLLDPDVLHNVLEEGPQFFKPDKAELFMPLEFSTAAFRFGHSMVRNEYQWNYFHSAELFGPIGINVLFDLTNFSGHIKPVEKDKHALGPALPSRWVIDWRRFFDFDVIRVADQPKYRKPNPINFARRIDTTIDMKLEATGTAFPHDSFTGPQRSIAVRNLLRGYSLQLPTGEEVADWIGPAAVLTQADIARGFEEIFSSRPLKGKTPLWYYILREADVCHSGDRLGPIGSRIVAETIVTLIKNSKYSVLNEPAWRPRTDASRPGANPTDRIFQMVDLLNFANIVNSIKM
jgi:hypothetical protein